MSDFPKMYNFEDVKSKINKITKRTIIFDEKLTSDENIDYFENKINIGDIIEIC